MTAQTDLTDHDMLIRIDTTVTAMSTKITSLCKKVDDGEDARNGLSNRVTRLEERMSIWQVGQAAWSALLSAVAAVIGTRK